MGELVLSNLDFQIRPMNEPMVHTVIMLITVAFILTSALPFVPGAEIGFGLLVMLGGRIAILVYISMVCALFLAFMVGKLVPVNTIASFFNFLGFERGRRLILDLGSRNTQECYELMVGAANSSFIKRLIKHRYLMLIALLNLPGNSIIGGGGGIALCAGMSGIYNTGRYLVSIMIAVAPIPIFFFFFR